MRQIKLGRHALVGKLFDAIQSLASLLMAIIFALLFLAANFSFFSGVSAIITRFFLYGVLRWPVPQEVSRYITGDWYYDLLGLLTSGATNQAPAFLVACAIMAIAVMIADRLRQARLRYATGLLYLFLLSITAYTLFRLFTSGPTNPWSYFAALFLLPMVVAGQIGAWIAPLLQGLQTPDMLTSLGMPKANAGLIAAMPAMGAALLACYAVLQGVREFVGLAIDRNSRGVFRRSLAHSRITPPRGSWPRLRDIVRALWPILRAALIATSLGLLVLAALPLVVQLLGTSLMPYLQLAFRMTGSLAGGLGLAVYGPIILVLLIAWLALRLAGHRRPELLELAVVTTLFVVILFLLDRTPLSLSENQQALFPTMFASPFVLIAFPQRHLMWKGFAEAMDLWRSAWQPPLRTRADAGRAPALYLRAFQDDEKTLPASFDVIDGLMGTWQRSNRFEELIARSVGNWRPVVALGNPHLAYQLHGAMKRQVEDEQWQDEVAYWNGSSAYVVMVANKTDNIAWEVALIQETGKHQRAIFVLTDARMTTQFFATFPILPEGTKVPEDALVVYYDSNRGWTCLTSRSRTQSVYRLAMDIAVSHLEEQVRV